MGTARAAAGPRGLTSGIVSVLAAGGSDRARGFPRSYDERRAVEGSTGDGIVGNPVSTLGGGYEGKLEGAPTLTEYGMYSFSLSVFRFPFAPSTPGM